MNKDDTPPTFVYFLASCWNENQIAICIFNFYYEMTAHEEERRVLKENQLFLSRLLQDNNAAKFQQHL